MTDNIDRHNKLIVATKYFSINDAIKAPIKSKTAFIIANERITSSGNIGRYYTVFPKFSEFLKNRNKYKHCHEILVDHNNNKPNLAGRLVFDFDIQLINIKKNNKSILPMDFKKQIENNIVEVIEKYFNNVDTDRFKFIWSTSLNPAKFSKHLTVKNLYFENWVSLSKIFYQLFCLSWDENHSWIKSAKLIDSQIVRNRGSLRMVDSTKINGYVLTLDNKKHTLADSLIRIYLKTQRENEQLILKSNINEGVFSDILCENIVQLPTHFNMNCGTYKMRNVIFDKKIYTKAFEIYNSIDKNVFKMGKIDGNFLSLVRIKKYKCLISNEIHNRENAFLSITKYLSSYLNAYFVKFGCFRFCSEIRTISIGSIDIDSLDITISPNLILPDKKMAM